MMTFRLRRLLFSVAAMSLVASADSRTQEARRLWTDVAEGSLPRGGERLIVPSAARIVLLDRAELDAVLVSAPMERTAEAQDRSVLLDLPIPDGSFRTFRIEESPVMAPELSAKFSEIRTYAGDASTGRAWSTRFDVTPAGFHAMIFTPEGTVFVDPYRQGDTEHYLCYFRRDLPLDEARRFFCEGALDELGSAADIERRLSLGVRLSGSQLRT